MTKSQKENFYAVLAAIRRRERCEECTKIAICKLYPYWDRERCEPKLCVYKEIRLTEKEVKNHV